MKPAYSSLRESHHPDEEEDDEPGSEARTAWECHLPLNTPGEIQFIHHRKHTPSAAPSGGPVGVPGVSGHFLPE